MNYLQGCVFLVLFFSCLTQGQTQNTDFATKAVSVTASSSSMQHDGHSAVDGSPNSYWECQGSPSAPCWIQIDWKEPELIRELVIRRWEPRRGAQDLTHLKAEFSDGTSWSIETTTRHFYTYSQPYAGWQFEATTITS